MFQQSHKYVIKTITQSQIPSVGFTINLFITKEASRLGGFFSKENPTYCNTPYLPL